MKKRRILWGAVVFMVLSGCEKREVPLPSSRPDINSLLAERAAEESSEVAPVPTPDVSAPPITLGDGTEIDGTNTLVPPEEEVELGIDKEVDLDLAPFGMNAAYAEVVRILRERDGYIGKKVRILGRFTSFKSEKGEDIPMIIVADVTACCMQGLEFRLEDGIFPEDYPEVGERILLWGTIELKTAYNGYDYPYVRAFRYEAI